MVLREQSAHCRAPSRRLPRPVCPPRWRTRLPATRNLRKRAKASQASAKNANRAGIPNESLRMSSFHMSQDGADLEAAKSKVAALTAPRNAVLVGASDRAGSWSARVWRNLNRYAFPGPIYLVNPRRTEIWNKPCYPDLASLPEPPDHLVVLVPAAGVIETLRAGGAAGARSATVFSAGFGESFDTEAAALGRELAAVIEQSGLGVSGPNCMGNVCAKSKLVTLTE